MASSVDGKPITPKQGDITFCLMCAEMYTLDNNKWRSLTDDELIDLPLKDKKYLSGIQIGIREFHKQRREKD